MPFEGTFLTLFLQRQGCILLKVNIDILQGD